MLHLVDDIFWHLGFKSAEHAEKVASQITSINVVWLLVLMLGCSRLAGCDFRRRKAAITKLFHAKAFGNEANKQTCCWPRNQIIIK
jgi:hypothetical protein